MCETSCLPWYELHKIYLISQTKSPLPGLLDKFFMPKAFWVWGQSLLTLNWGAKCLHVDINSRNIRQWRMAKGKLEFSWGLFLESVCSYLFLHFLSRREHERREGALVQFFFVRTLGFISSLPVSYFWSYFSPLYHSLPYSKNYKARLRARAMPTLGFCSP